MGIARSPLSVKLFLGMLSPDISLFDACAEILYKEFGSLDYESDVLPWDTTNYYREEMGDDIKRKFIFFDQLIDPGDLPKIKLCTNTIEKDYTARAGDALHRRINLDPGYVTEAKVVLATTKDFAHRIYIGSNIYAEVTLRYSAKDGRFTPCEHTYPDYRTDQYRTIFDRARERLRTARRRTKPA
jgi:hypothetical protein